MKYVWNPDENDWLKNHRNISLLQVNSEKSASNGHSLPDADFRSYSPIRGRRPRVKKQLKDILHLIAAAKPRFLISRSEISL